MFGYGWFQWSELLKVACEIGWTPDAFWRSTPCELRLAIEGYQVRLERYYEIVAFATAYIVKPHVKHPSRITPDKLLGRTTTRAGEMLKEEKAQADWLDECKRRSELWERKRVKRWQVPEQ